MLSPVAVTAYSEEAGSYGGNPGQLAGNGVFHSKRNGFVKSFVEHGLIMGLMSVRADITYQQGLHRMWSRLTRYDFYYPVLANLGEQAVLNKEIYYQNDAGGTQDNAVFGYQERNAEYRYKPSTIVGKLRSTYGTTLNIWHWAEKFTSLPALGSTFIQSNTPISRASAVLAEPHFVFDSFFNIRAARPMPLYSVPGLVDHF